MIYLVQRLAVAVQRGNAVSIMGTMGDPFLGSIYVYVFNFSWCCCCLLLFFVSLTPLFC